MSSEAVGWLKSLGVPLRALSSDSRSLGKATAFLAYPGEQDDGRRYIEAALAAGAVGVFWEPAEFAWQQQWQVPNLAVANLKQRCGELAHEVYGKPSDRLAVTAVTGTNGKTTVAHYLAQLLHYSGKSCGLIGTLGAGLYGRPMTPLANTTPDAAVIQDWLRQYAAANTAAAVIEASSHGICQGRLNGLTIACAVFTNAAQDHLDYHGSKEAYWQAKSALFDLPGVQRAVLNGDDVFCRRLKEERLPAALTYGQAGDDLMLLDVETRADGCLLSLDGVLGKRRLFLPPVGEHNVYNFLAAALAATVLDVSAEDIAGAAELLLLPEGRLQKMSNAPAVYVDYAHTPDAMAAVLAAARGHSSGRLIVVFGAGGERDTDKRGAMGRVAAAEADVIIVTDDNPRREDPAAIRAALVRAAGAAARNIGDRRLAIAEALRLARPEDTLLILGKGHETTQSVGGTEMPFSDADVVQDLCRKRQLCG